MLSMLMLLQERGADAGKGAGTGAGAAAAGSWLGTAMQWVLLVSVVIAIGLVVWWMIPVLVRRWRMYVLNKSAPPPPQGATDQGEGFSRDSIAWTVVVVGAAVVLMLTIMAIRDSSKGSIDRVLASVLPLVGTWVGTVMAYYFGERNLRAAAESVRAGQVRDDRKPVTEVMIGLGSIKFATMEADAKGDKPELLLLTEITKLMKDHKVFRVPVFRKDKSVAMVVHSDPLNQFLITQADAGQDLAARNLLTLKQLLEDTTIGPRIVGKISFVGESDTIGQAKGAMQGVSGCQDVFVTKKGGPRDEIVGWLTNNEIQRFAE